MGRYTYILDMGRYNYILDMCIYTYILDMWIYTYTLYTSNNTNRVVMKKIELKKENGDVLPTLEKVGLGAGLGKHAILLLF